MLCRLSAYYSQHCIVMHLLAVSSSSVMKISNQCFSQYFQRDFLNIVPQYRVFFLFFLSSICNIYIFLNSIVCQRFKCIVQGYFVMFCSVYWVGLQGYVLFFSAVSIFFILLLLVHYCFDRDRDRDRRIYRQTQRERQTHRQTNRQRRTDRNRQRETEKKRENERERSLCIVAVKFRLSTEPVIYESLQLSNPEISKMNVDALPRE